MAFSVGMDFGLHTGSKAKGNWAYSSVWISIYTTPLPLSWKLPLTPLKGERRLCFFVQALNSRDEMLLCEYLCTERWLALWSPIYTVSCRKGGNTLLLSYFCLAGRGREQLIDFLPSSHSPCYRVREYALPTHVVSKFALWNGGV